MRSLKASPQTRSGNSMQICVFVPPDLAELVHVLRRLARGTVTSAGCPVGSASCWSGRMPIPDLQTRRCVSSSFSRSPLAVRRAFTRPYIVRIVDCMPLGVPVSLERKVDTRYIETSTFRWEVGGEASGLRIPVLEDGNLVVLHVRIAAGVERLGCVRT